MKFSICNEVYEDRPFAAACEDAASCGYDGIEIAPFTLAESPHAITERDAKRVGETARRAGLEVVGLHWLLAGARDVSLTSDDADVRRHTQEYVSHLARMCAAMEGKVMVWGSPRQRWIEPEQRRERAESDAVEVVRGVCEVAGPLGVTIAMEPLSVDEANFLTTASEAIAFIKRVDHPACRLLLDVKAMSREQAGYADIIRRGGPYLAHFHANDANRRGPGFGDVDFVPIMAALQKVGYEDYVSVEVFDYSPDAHTIAEASLRYLHEAIDAIPAPPSNSP